MRRNLSWSDLWNSHIHKYMFIYLNIFRYSLFYLSSLPPLWLFMKVAYFPLAFYHLNKYGINNLISFGLSTNHCGLMPKQHAIKLRDDQCQCKTSLIFWYCWNRVTLSTLYVCVARPIRSTLYILFFFFFWAFALPSRLAYCSLGAVFTILLLSIDNNNCHNTACVRADLSSFFTIVREPREIHVKWFHIISKSYVFIASLKLSFGVDLNLSFSLSLLCWIWALISVYIHACVCHLFAN